LPPEAARGERDRGAVARAPKGRMASRRRAARRGRSRLHIDGGRGMIVSCAPFRVSFAGGGSDIASFYRRHRGAVLSCAIAKYSFIVVHPFFNANKYNLKYAQTELVDRIEDVQHPILREALRMQRI